jgi:selenocysteine lyase/cysteine desulfurase
VKLKEKMSIEKMKQREEEIVHTLFQELPKIDRLNILAADHRERLAVVSFYIDGLHYNLGVKLLNDYFGIQMRGGCSCAGTYGHYLLHIPKEVSKKITDKIDHGDLSEKPGWIRMSIHPVMANEEVAYIIDALKEIVRNYEKWGKEYIYNAHANEYVHKNYDPKKFTPVHHWMDID